MTLRVVLLNMLEIRSLLEPLDIPIQVFEVVVQEWVVVPNGAEIALEMLHVDRVEPDQRHVCADVDFGQLCTEYIRAAAVSEQILKLVEGREDGNDISVVRLLVRREAGFVDARVEMALHPVAYCIDPRSEMLRIECHGYLLLWEERVEGCLQVTEEFSALVVDDRAGLLVPEHRDAVAALVLLVCFEVDFMEVRAAEEVVDGRLWVLVVALWELPSGPAPFVAFGVWLDD